MSCDTLIVTESEVSIVEASTALVSVVETDGDVSTIITTSDDVSIVTVDDPSTVIVEPDVLRNVEVLTVGEQGPPGRDGSSLSSVLSLTAAITISGHRVVASNAAGLAVYASSDDAADANMALGVSTGAALAGSTVEVQYAGTLVEPSWAWTPKLPVFCGANGVLTQVVPTDGFALIIGVAMTATSLAISIKQPIITV